MFMKKIFKRLRQTMALVFALLIESINVITSYAYSTGVECSLLNTGDSMAIFIWILVLFVALGGIITAINSWRFGARCR